MKLRVIQGQMSLESPADLDRYICHAQGERCADYDAEDDSSRCRYFLPTTSVRRRDCALDLAERGPRTAEEVAAILEEPATATRSVEWKARDILRDDLDARALLRAAGEE